MALSKFFDRLASLKTNNLDKRLSKRSRMRFGLYFYKDKSKDISNLNYNYFANLFYLLTNINPAMRVKEKNKALYYSLYYKFKSNIYCYKFLTSNFLKYYPSDMVSLMSNNTELRFVVNNHIVIFKNLRKYNKEIYDEKFDNSFIVFVQFDTNLDKRLINIIF